MADVRGLDRDQQRELALPYSCPVCGSLPGWDCMTPLRYPNPWPHTARVLLGLEPKEAA